MYQRTAAIIESTVEHHESDRHHPEKEMTGAPMHSNAYMARCLTLRVQ